MKVKLLQSIGNDKVSYHRGDIYQCDDAEAVRLVRAGYAEATDDKAFAKAEKAFDDAVAADQQD